MRVRFGGLGGQGVVVSGVIYGHAAMNDDYNVLQSQSYGSTTRGGVTSSDVTLERGEICELEAPDYDVLVVMCQEALDKYLPKLVDGGLLITEKSLIDVEPEDTKNVKHVAIPSIDAAREQLGRQILANIVSLGSLSQLNDAVSKEALETAILANVPKGTEQLNKKAFELGAKLAKEATA